MTGPIIAGILGLIYFFYPTEYDRLMGEALKVQRENSSIVEFDGFKEPPMPDRSENNKTMLGVDSDNNGIRDDIDIWINRTGKSYNERMALRQLAISELQSLLICKNENWKDTSFICQKIADAESCLLRISKDGYELRNKMTELLKNNSTRKKCNNFYQKASCSSTLFVKDGEKKCLFELQK